MVARLRVELMRGEGVCVRGSPVLVVAAPALAVEFPSKYLEQALTFTISTFLMTVHVFKDEAFPDFSGIPDFLIAAYIFRKYQSPIISY